MKPTPFHHPTAHPISTKPITHQTMKIIIAGGAGYIGSITTENPIAQGDDV